MYGAKQKHFTQMVLSNPIGFYGLFAATFMRSRRKVAAR